MKNLFKGFVLCALFWSIAFSVKADTIVNPVGESMDVAGQQYDDLNNYGEVNVNDAYINGAFNNYGNVIARGAFSIASGEGNGSNVRIINHPAGNMVVMGYMDFYSADSIFENAGRFSAIDSWYTMFPEPFTLLLRGTIKNTGSFLIDKPRPRNACEQGPFPGSRAIENEGKFEISQDTNCNFSERGYSNITRYNQDGGELKVDGYFATDDTRINGGTISGAGTIEGLDYRLLNKVTLSPGSPIGTLSITSNRPYLFCGKCSIDIELSGVADSDRLQINSRFFITGWRLNVLLRDGYVPQQGDSFDIINADNGIVIFGNTSSYSNLPELPGGLGWDVQNDGTTITLSVI